jgi:hypothetical protein
MQKKFYWKKLFVDIVKMKNPLNRRFIISKLVDKFLKKYIENLLEILMNQDNKFELHHNSMVYQ